MAFDIINKQFDKLTSRLNVGDVIYLVIGVCSMVVGVLIDVFAVRVICLFTLLVSAVLVYATIRAKQLNIQTGKKNEGHFSQPLIEREVMKKLIFDDFQHHAKRGYLSDDTENDKLNLELPRTSNNTSPRDYSSALSAVKPAVPVELSVMQVFKISDFFDTESEVFKGDTEPRTEFDFILNKVLKVIKEVLFAHTVAFFWANNEKQQMIMEAHVSDSPNFFSSRRFTMGDDLVSKVAKTGKPEFISEVNELSEHELLRYYDSPVSVKSFIGVPVFFVKETINESIENPVAVIAVDSKAKDEFGHETFSLLGQFTKLISALIKSYNDKYDLLLDAELLSSIRRLQERVRNNFSLNVIVQSLAEETSKLINWDFLSIVLYDETKRAWTAKKITNRAHEGYIVTEQAIDFPESIVGQTIKNNSHNLINDLEKVSKPRYFAEEKLETKGSFISVPVSSINKCYGAINVESRDKYNFSRRDVEMLYRLAENTASALEVYYMQEIINEYVIVDDNTGAYSKKYFMQRIEEELQRADDTVTELSLLFLMIDKSEELQQRFGTDGFERIMLALSKAIRSSIRHYDLLGRQGTNRFGVLLISTPSNEAYLWAEKIRKHIAGLVINLDGKTFSITVSVGVSGVLEGMKTEELIGNTVAVLNAAAQAGGNVVRVF